MRFDLKLQKSLNKETWLKTIIHLYMLQVNQTISSDPAPASTLCAKLG